MKNGYSSSYTHSGGPSEPFVQARYLTEEKIFVTCPYCFNEHIHLGDKKSSQGTSRVSHCHQGGYRLNFD